MPRYDYKCMKCGKVEEKISPMDSKEKFWCTKCLSLTMVRMFSPQGTVFQVRWGRPSVRKKVRKMGA